MSGKLTTLDQLASTPNWEEIQTALEEQGLSVVGSKVYVAPDLHRALEEAEEALQEGDFNPESLFPIFDLNRIEGDTTEFQTRLDRILGYDTEVDAGIVGVKYRDLKRLYEGADPDNDFEDAVTDVLQDLTDDFFALVGEGLESSSDEEEGAASSDAASEAGEEGEDDEAAASSSEGEVDDDDEEGSDEDGEVAAAPLAVPTLRIMEAMPALPTVGQALPTVTPLAMPILPTVAYAPLPQTLPPAASKPRGRKPKVPQPPPMALPMTTDLSALNQARDGLAQIQEINPEAYFQQQIPAQTAAPPRLNILPAVPLPTLPTGTTVPLTLQLPQVQLPQVQAAPAKIPLPTIGLPTGPVPALTVEIPRFTTKLDAAPAPVSGVAVAVARQGAGSATAPMSVQQAALEIAKQINPLKINAGRVSRDDKEFYTTDELKEFARAMGLRMSGSKAEVIDRIKAVMRQAGVNV